MYRRMYVSGRGWKATKITEIVGKILIGLNKYSGFFSALYPFLSHICCAVYGFKFPQFPY